MSIDEGSIVSEVVVVGSMKAKEGHEDEVAEALRAVAALTHEEEGCLLYAVHRGLDEPGRVVLVERWSSREALDEHFQKPYVRELGKSTHLLAEPAQVWFLDALPSGDPGKGAL